MKSESEINSGLSNTSFTIITLTTLFVFVSFLLAFLLQRLNFSEVIDTSLLAELETIRLINELLANFIPLFILPLILALVVLYFTIAYQNSDTIKKRRFGGYFKKSLTDNKFINKLIKKRYFQFLFEGPVTLVFLFVILFGLFGYGGYIQAVDSGYKNAATFLTWVIWWPIIGVTFLFVGRSWCTMCPLGCTGEWVQRTHLPKQTSTKQKIIRGVVGVVFAYLGSLFIGVTIGVLGGKKPVQLVGPGVLTLDFPFVFYQYIIFLYQLPGFLFSSVLASFSSQTSEEAIFGLLWLILIAISAIISFVLGYVLPEFIRAMVYGNPDKQNDVQRRKFPKIFQNRWITAVFFALILVFDFSVGMFVNPYYTALFIIILLVMAISMSMIYERRAFCQYVCPLGGIFGVYGMNSVIEVRNKDLNVCKSCKGKYCLNGRTSNKVVEHENAIAWNPGYGCPVGEFPMVMEESLDCILCSECFKACPSDNIALNIRSPFVDTFMPKKRKLGEAGLAIVIVSLSFLFLTPSIPGAPQGLEGGFFMPLLLFLLMIAITSVLVRSKNISFKDIFTTFGITILPLGLSLHFSFWMMRIVDHSLSVLKILADPFGNQFMGYTIYDSSLIVTNPVTLPVAILYMFNPLFILNVHTMTFGPLLRPSLAFLIRTMIILLGMSGSLYATHRSAVLNLKMNKSDLRETVNLLLPIFVWIMFMTALGLIAISHQV